MCAKSSIQQDVKIPTNPGNAERKFREPERTMKCSVRSRDFRSTYAINQSSANCHAVRHAVARASDPLLWRRLT